jgi:hypothetical protein
MPDKKVVRVIHVDPKTGIRTPMLIPASLLEKQARGPVNFGNRCGKCGHMIDEGGHCAGCRSDHNPVPSHLH